jgi:hypothetical protein
MMGPFGEEEWSAGENCENDFSGNSKRMVWAEAMAGGDWLGLNADVSWQA